MEYILYCDESTASDVKYGDFFGGCLVSAADLNPIVQALEQCKLENHLFGEIKWTKVTDQYLDKYEAVIRLFFQFVRDGKIKVRIMFRSMENQYIAASKDDKYFKLYYQFIKHAFGFSHTVGMETFRVRVYLDQLPAKKDAANQFKDYLANMQNTQSMSDCAMHIPRDQIAEIKSHDHVLLQCVDIVMGAMQFRLNRHHLDKPEGADRRGKKTIAKEKLYKAILNEIRTIYPKFNIGISTGAQNYSNPHWESPYEHWEFTPYPTDE